LNRIVLFSLAVAFNLGMVVMNIPAALDALMPLYQVSYVNISILISALWWTHGLTLIPGGILADRFGVGRTMAASLALIGLSNFLPVFSTDFYFALTARAICGIGTGMGFAANMKLVALSVSQKKSGSYQAYMAGCVSLGSIVVYLLLPLLTEINWCFIYMIPALFSFLLMPFLRIFSFPGPNRLSAPPSSLKQIVGLPKGWILGCLHAMCWGSIVALGSWMPSFVAEARGVLSTMPFAWAGAMVMFISAVGRIFGGVALTKLSAHHIAVGSILVLCLLYLCLFLGPSAAMVVILGGMAAWFASFNFGAIFQLGSQMVSPNSIGALFGFINFIANVGAFFFTFLFGWFKDETGSFAWAFGILAVFCFSSFLLGRFGLHETAAGPTKVQ
jgi:MFS transporter, NNP family, nitrate/nitrite transporter